MAVVKSESTLLMLLTKHGLLNMQVKSISIPNFFLKFDCQVLRNRIDAIPGPERMYARAQLILQDPEAESWWGSKGIALGSC